MKRKDEVELVENVIKKQSEMNALTVDKINECPVTEPEIQTKLTKKQLAAQEKCLYIEPSKRMPPLGKLPENQQREHTHDWEYVKGILENIEVAGEPLTFWYVKYPGDPDCLWTIPCNRPVYVPRMIAKHLESCMKYHKFDYREKNPQFIKALDFMESFEAVDVCWRAKFRPIEAFA